MQSTIKSNSICSEIILHSRVGGVVTGTDEAVVDLFTPLTLRGLDRFTDSRIEHIICTSALAAFF